MTENQKLRETLEDVNQFLTSHLTHLHGAKMVLGNEAFDTPIQSIERLQKKIRMTLQEDESISGLNHERTQIHFGPDSNFKEHLDRGNQEKGNGSSEFQSQNSINKSP